MQRKSNQFLFIGILLALVGGISAYVVGSDLDSGNPPPPTPPIANNSEIFWNVENLTIDIDSTDNGTNSNVTR